MTYLRDFSIDIPFIEENPIDMKVEPSLIIIEARMPVNSL